MHDMVMETAGREADQPMTRIVQNEEVTLHAERMARSFFEQVTSEVVIDGDNYVIVRKLTHGEVSAITSRCLKQSAKIGEDGEVEQTMELDAMEYRDQHIFKALVSWHGPGFGGRELTLKNFLALPDAVVNIIGRGVDAFNKMSEDTKNA